MIEPQLPTPDPEAPERAQLEHHLQRLATDFLTELPVRLGDLEAAWVRLHRLPDPAPAQAELPWGAQRMLAVVTDVE